jgi:hypothetical protein
LVRWAVFRIKAPGPLSLVSLLDAYRFYVFHMPLAMGYVPRFTAFAMAFPLAGSSST